MTHKGLRVYSLLLVVAVFFLITAGALVTSNNAGLAVPDWPTTYGQNMFFFPVDKWVGGIFYEHFHRIIASVIGLMTIVLTIWIHIVEKGRRNWLCYLAYGALLAVILQGVLGGLTVIYKLPDFISVSHGMLGQLFLLITVWIAYAYGTKADLKLKISRASIFIPALFAFYLIIVQLFLGAWMRHSESGLAFVDFPTAGGSITPFVTESMLQKTNAIRQSLNMPEVNLFQAWIHIAHRFWAIVVLAGVTFLILRMFKTLKAHALILSLLILSQLLLGIITIFTLRNPYVTSGHVLFGAATLVAVFLAVLRSHNQTLRA